MRCRKSSYSLDTPPSQPSIRRTEYNYTAESSFQLYLIDKALDLHQNNDGFPSFDLCFDESKLLRLKQAYEQAVQGYNVMIKDEDLFNRLIISRYYVQEPIGKLRSSYIKKSCSHSVKLIKIIETQPITPSKEEGMNSKNAKSDKQAISTISSILVASLYIVAYIEDSVNLFCRSSLIRIRYIKEKSLSAKELMLEYMKRWNAYVEAIQSIGLQLQPISQLFNSVFNSIYNTLLYPVYPAWSIERMMIIAWRANVLKPLIEDDKLDMQVYKMIYDCLISNTPIPSVIKLAFNGIIVDLNCNESNILYLGHPTLFNPDQGLVIAKNKLTDLVNQLNQELTNSGESFMEFGYKYIALLKGVFPLFIERSLLNMILVHMEILASKMLFDTCKQLFNEIKSKNFKYDIIEVLITDDIDSLQKAHSFANTIYRMITQLSMQCGIEIDQHHVLKCILCILKQYNFQSVESYKEIVLLVSSKTICSDLRWIKQWRRPS